jgi:hypothetical protein
LREVGDNIYPVEQHDVGFNPPIGTGAVDPPSYAAIRCRYR